MRLHAERTWGCSVPETRRCRKNIKTRDESLHAVRDTFRPVAGMAAQRRIGFQQAAQQGQEIVMFGVSQLGVRLPNLRNDVGSRTSNIGHHFVARTRPYLPMMRWIECAGQLCRGAVPGKQKQRQTAYVVDVCHEASQKPIVYRVLIQLFRGCIRWIMAPAMGRWRPGLGLC